MSDDDIRALFHRVDDGPPLGIDVREVMAHGRRVRTRRTGLAIGGSVLGVAVAAVAIGLSIAGDPASPDLNRPAEPPATSTTSTVVPVPPRQEPDTKSPTGNNPSPPGPGNGEPDEPAQGSMSPPGGGS